MLDTRASPVSATAGRCESIEVHIAVLLAA
jgi:hypothetical protein